MQLFISDFEKKSDTIIISDLEIIPQIRKVLRMKIWDVFFIQNPNPPIVRYYVEISDRNDKWISWKIQDEKIYDTSEAKKTMIIAMPNKREKAELIAQKLTEIWIENIVFRPTERSVIKDRNEKKAERIFKISKEAVEQSRWRKLPTIKFTKNISEIIWENEIDVFDIPREWLSFDEWSDFKNIWLIWPEWWLTDLDYINLKSENISIKSLWNSVLRMETAVIVGWRLLKN
jgi:RsmE family RNA methyltransferase